MGAEAGGCKGTLGGLVIFEHQGIKRTGTVVGHVDVGCMPPYSPMYEVVPVKKKMLLILRGRWYYLVEA